MRIVVLCGGAGARLWPESRESFPKQFIPIFNDKSLLDLTIERILSLKFESEPIFICNKKHGFLVRQALEKFNLKAHVFLEPVGKNTCAAIYLAAKFCSNTDNLLIIPSDHFIPNINKFTEDILNINKNLSPDHIITLGIKPTKPSEAYGYIKVSGKRHNTLCEVLRFIEKPNKVKASEYVKDKNYYWNAGIFIANSLKLLSSIQKYAPSIAMHCDTSFDNMKINKKTNEYNFSIDLFSLIPSESIDYAIMEHENNIYLYPFNHEWNDVGSWDSIAEISEINDLNNQVIEIDSINTFIRSKKRIIATIGVEDLIIVDDDNATLISKKNQTEKVKQIVKKLSAKNKIEAKEHSFENRPWGRFENLYNDKNCKVKRIVVNAKRRLSLQYHNFRSEHWIVVYGTAKVYLDGKFLTLTSGQSIDIPLKMTHYLQNDTDEDLIIIETQLGTYFGEDDIIRLDDPYNRY